MNKIIINLTNLEYNFKQIKQLFPNYQYYMAVVKSNAYGLGMDAIKVISSLADYLVVANIEEAIEIRKEDIKIPILVLEPIQSSQLHIYEDYQLTATIDSMKTLSSIKNSHIKIHIKVNTGMNRFGFSNKEEILEACHSMENSNLILEGIYTHLYYVDDKIITQQQIDVFTSILQDIPISIPVVHIFNSQATSECRKVKEATGIRIGDLLYGLTEHKDLHLKSTFSLQTNILSIRKVFKGQTVGYDGSYKIEQDGTIAILPIGYSHGLIKSHIGTDVFIHGNPYPIIANTMNSTFIKIDETVQSQDCVQIYKDTDHIIKLSKQLNTVPQELMLILNHIKKEYKKDNH